MDVDDKRFLPAKRKAPKKQKRRVVSSDEGEDVVIDSDDEPEADEDDEDDEDDDVSATKRRPSAKAKPAASSRAKAKSAKGKGDTVKDEPRLAPASRASSVAANDEAASALAAQSSADTAPARPTTDKDPADPLVPKKRKLPTIKKNKPPGTAGPSTAAKPSPLPPSTDDLKPSVPTILQRKTATALSGAQDLDLSNQQVYASLFKGSSNAPGSGNRREKEGERRKELNRLRDEARAKRAEDAKHTFDLQAQADKIGRFERRLRAENSTVLHPNFLAAKFRDEWEMERRRRRDDREPSPVSKEE